LGFKSCGNFVNSVNSNRRSHLTAGDLLLGSRRVRGRLWLRAGLEKLLRVVFVSVAEL